MQNYADNYLQLNYSTCFGRPSRPSSGLHKTVVAASGTDRTIWGTNKLVVPEAATTVLCTPDDGHNRRPKYVE